VTIFTGRCEDYALLLLLQFDFLNNMYKISLFDIFRDQSELLIEPLYSLLELLIGLLGIPDFNDFRLFTPVYELFGQQLVIVFNHRG